MDKKDLNVFRKHFRLMGLGVALQMLSGIFFLAGALGTLREVNAKARELLIQKLTDE